MDQRTKSALKMITFIVFIISFTKASSFYLIKSIFVIKDEEGIPIPGAKLVNTKTGISYGSDSSGIIQCELKEGDSFCVKRLGYQSFCRSYKLNADPTITLSNAYITLPEASIKVQKEMKILEYPKERNFYTFWQSAKIT